MQSEPAKMVRVSKHRHAPQNLMPQTISIAVPSALLCSTAHGMEFKKVADQGHPGQFFIYETGEIVPGDRDTFERLATDGTRDVVFFNSPGGSLGEGLAIGAVIRDRDITTAVSAPNPLLFGMRPRLAWWSNASSRRRATSAVMLHLSITKG
jgi:hypothetical protein